MMFGGTGSSSEDFEWLHIKIPELKSFDALQGLIMTSLTKVYQLCWLIGCPYHLA